MDYAVTIANVIVGFLLIWASKEESSSWRVALLIDGVVLLLIGIVALAILLFFNGEMTTGAAIAYGVIAVSGFITLFFVR